MSPRGSARTSSCTAEKPESPPTLRMAQRPTNPPPNPTSLQISRLRSPFDLARQQLGKAACRRKHAYGLRARPQAFAVGSWVWCLVPRRRQGRYRKWQCLYEGPFQVVKVLGPVTYQIQRTARSRPWTVHVDKLKPCHTEVRDDPATAAEPPPADSSSEPLVPNARPRRNIRLPARYA